MLMVSGFSGLFQGMLKSPEMRILLELLNKDVIWCGNSPKKVNIVTGCLAEYGVVDGQENVLFGCDVQFGCQCFIGCIFFEG